MFSLKGLHCTVVGWLQLLDAIYSQLYKVIKMAKAESIVVCVGHNYSMTDTEFRPKPIPKPKVSNLQSQSLDPIYSQLLPEGAGDLRHQKDIWQWLI